MVEGLWEKSKQSNNYLIEWHKLYVFFQDWLTDFHTIDNK
jgi:hypothetical protein